MLVVRDDVRRISSECTIHKLVIIVVSFNQMLAKIGINKFYVRTFQKKMNDIVCHFHRHLLSDFLGIFFQNLSRNTQDILPCL